MINKNTYYLEKINYEETLVKIEMNCIHCGVTMYPGDKCYIYFEKYGPLIKFCSIKCIKSYLHRHRKRLYQKCSITQNDFRAWLLPGNIKSDCKSKSLDNK